MFPVLLVREKVDVSWVCGTVCTRRDQSGEGVIPTDLVNRGEGSSNTVTRGAPIRHRAGFGPRRSHEFLILQSNKLPFEGVHA